VAVTESGVKVAVTTSPRSVTSSPARASRVTNPAARRAAGACSCPAWCEPALVAAPITVTAVVMGTSVAGIFHPKTIMGAIIGRGSGP
jgi:hypothetical protein